MSDQRLESLALQVEVIERRLFAFEAHVIKLLAGAARAKAPPIPPQPWTGGKIIDTRKDWNAPER